MDRSLRAFLAVAEAGNLTLAATRLGLTQPAVTKTIRRLEQDYRAKLFERRARGMTLTPEGEALFARARAIEIHYRQADEEVRALRAAGVGAMRVVAGPSYSMTIVPELARRLARAFPGTRFTFDFDVGGGALPRLLAGEVDLMLGGLIDLPPEGVDTTPLFDVEMAAFCCAANPLAKSGPLTPRALADRSWIIYKRDAQVTERLADYCTEHRLPPPRVAMEVDALAVSFRIVRGSPFLTLAPRQLEQAAREAGLARLPLGAPIWTFASGACCRGSWSALPIMRRALAELRDLARSDAAKSGARLAPAAQ